jgi:hypothetical protein
MEGEDGESSDEVPAVDKGGNHIKFSITRITLRYPKIS